MAAVGLQSPWITFFEKVKAIFKEDPEVEISDYIIKSTYTDTNDNGKGVYTIKIVSTNGDKIEALRKIMKNNIPMGNIVVKIQFGVINDNQAFDASTEYPTVQDYATAFAGNPLFVDGRHVETPNGFVADYVIFAKEIIQFYNDDLSDFYGNFNGTVEDVASDIFIKSAGVFFSTASDDFIKSAGATLN